MTDLRFPVELEAPDISAYRNGNTGVEYVTTFDSGRAGPHVMVSAVVHGNELCGAIVLDWLLKMEAAPTRRAADPGFRQCGCVSAIRSGQPVRLTLC